MTRHHKIRYAAGALVAGCALAVSSAWAVTAETPDPAVAVSYRAFDGDNVHVFTNSGTFKVTEAGSVRLLVVGGGGGGGTGGGGGGGGGQVVEQTLDLPAGEYAVTVGAGGAVAQPGGASLFGELVTALGGGKGGGVNSGGGAGANGGGGGFSWSGTNGGAATAGFAGGRGYTKGGGGGGGAGGLGGECYATNTWFNRNEGMGGVGVCSDITGAPAWYAGGGGGGGYGGYGSYGGKGGGGDGGNSSNATNFYTLGHAGQPNTGGGGGGGGMYGNTQYEGAGGGSGVVVVRYSDGTTPPVAATDLPMAAVDGSVSTRVAPDGSIVHIFSGDGTFTVERGGAVELLVVGGGGGGSVQNSYGSGGGAGGLVLTNLTVVPGTYGVRVGAGGVGGYPGVGGCGQPSYFGGGAAANFGIVALGGGGASEINQPGQPGGSGGGGGYRNSGVVSEPGPGCEGQGHAGGRGCYVNGVYGDITCPRSCGGGGGGAGEPGHDGFAETAYGAGGDGRLLDISGEPVWYAGGGGAGNQGSVGSCAGGLGGGGAGGSSSAAGANGVDGTGGGGGGGGGTGNDDSTTIRSKSAGNGGSGVVIVRYRANWKLYGEATGGEVKRVKGRIVHTFVDSGTFTVTRPGHYEFFLVGGGGGGGHFGGGGGGAGGVVLTNGYLLAGEYAVTVGAGGTCGLNGTDSSVATFVAVGGGGGGDYETTGHNVNPRLGGAGGSGGGGSRIYGGQLKNNSGGAGVAGQGFDGGFGRCCVDADGNRVNADAGGGGGGAGGPGHDGYLPDEANGGFLDENGCVSTAYVVDARGGDGILCDFDGVEQWYAGGGGGSRSYCYMTVNNAECSGGKGGGGHGAGAYGSGSGYLLNGQDGTPNTGGGGGAGGGGGTNNQYEGGTGGSGVVMIRYVAPPKGACLLVR
ncbi:MAG: glycine-rich domain-containing protein [Kiritimatiellia bacterium]